MQISDWEIDKSAGRPILIYKGCSIIEGSDADFVLGAIKAALSGVEPSAYLHTLHMELDQKQKCVNFRALDPFGQRGHDYSISYSVTTEPLYTAAPTPSVAVKAKKPKLPPISEELYENYPAMSAQTHRDLVKDYARAAVASALSAQVQDVAGRAAMEFPETLSDDLRDALSTMLWTSGQIAACLRAGGDQIKTRAEDEQAHVLHWLISLALKHGPEWRSKASERIKAIRDAAAPAKQEGV
ncbi:hypothetical protein [Agrobacterium tumefaciens]|uniref:hypothetical protein n=1 Tax=Agrobacterium tumefaciens TaxID=358 RepID=UPI003B9E2C78